MRTGPFSASPCSIPGCCRACWSFRRRGAGIRTEAIGVLAFTGAQLAPIVDEARTVGQFIAPAHERLSALAHNLWWCWDHETTSLFRELDPVLWRRTRP